MTANAPASAATSSVSAIGGSNGAPSGSPLIAAKPLIASAIVAKPGRDAYGPSWPKPVTRRITKPRLRACNTSGPRPSRSSAARPEVLDQHVGAIREFEQTIAIGVRLQVERDTTLPSPEQFPRVGVAAFGREPPHAPDTVAAGSLDLDDIGAEVGEVAGRAGTREHRRHIDDAQALERVHRQVTSLRGTTSYRLREAAVGDRSERVVAVQAREHPPCLLGPAHRAPRRRCAAPSGCNHLRRCGTPPTRRDSPSRTRFPRSGCLVLR